MRIVEVHSANVEDYLDDILTLSDEFLDQLSIRQNRTRLEKDAAIHQMVTDSATRLLVAVLDGNLIGVSYYNYGSGYACGGAYLWLNCIYIRKEHQHRGYGTQLLRHIEEDGKKHSIRLFLCCRDHENEASQKLFARSGFSQESLTMMSKTWG